MTEASPDPVVPAAAPSAGTYAVILLVEQQLSADDAARVRSLHTELDEPVAYHVLLPVEDAAALVQASLGTLGSGDTLLGPAGPPPIDVGTAEAAVHERGVADLKGTVAALEAAGATVGSASLAPDPPVDALATKIAEVDGREVIVLTAPHVVAEFFHVDWASQARRRLGVPVLHLLEHETFDEQAGQGEGNTGL